MARAVKRPTHDDPHAVSSKTACRVHGAGDGNLDGSDGEAIRNSAGSDNAPASHSSHVAVHGGAAVMVGVGKRTTSKARGHVLFYY